ncbi:MAG: T9SS type A sorting domain-containing protein [Rhodothermales bacterium]|nr:T9SS type A sorting domain-containing protein [Rhodothermales bacterium]
MQSVEWRHHLLREVAMYTCICASVERTRTCPVAIARSALVGAVLALLLAVPPRVAAQPAEVDTLWFEDWEGDFTDNWFVDAGTWEVGEPTSGPGAAYAGTQVAATILAGNYSDAAPDSRIVRFSSFVVPPAEANPRLRFWHWFSFGGGDFGRVEISADGGSTWEVLSGSYAGNSSGVWSHPLIDLTAYAGQEVQVAFFFHSQDTCTASPGCTTPGSGWYLDDLAVVSGPMQLLSPEDWESGLGHWSAESGTWEVGAPTSGPEACHSLSNCAATGLAGNYSDFASDSRLISPPFVVTDEFGPPRLGFWHWFSFGGGDFGNVQVREVGGEWESITSPFTGTSAVYSFFSASLASYLGQEVQVAFFFHSQDTCTASPGCTTPGPGWYLDDIEVIGVVSAEPGVSAGGFLLSGAYPNPTAAAATIGFELPAPAAVTVRVFDVLGREVATVLEAELPAGEHAAPWRAARLPAGVYVYRVEAALPGSTEARWGRLTLLE